MTDLTDEQLALLMRRSHLLRLDYDETDDVMVVLDGLHTLVAEVRRQRESLKKVRELAEHWRGSVVPTREFLRELARALGEVVMTEPLTDADALDAFMQNTNEHGGDPTAAIVDANGTIYLVIGEDRSGGGEWMTCWLVDGDAAGNNDRGDETCDECGEPLGRGRLPLDDARYPVTVVASGRS